MGLAQNFEHEQRIDQMLERLDKRLAELDLEAGGLIAAGYGDARAVGAAGLG